MKWWAVQLRSAGSRFLEKARRLFAFPTQKTSLLILFLVLGLGAAAMVHAQATGQTNASLDTSEWILLNIAKGFVWTAQVAGKVIVALIGLAAVPLMQYNNFATSPVISLGWSLTRDVVNLFFVIVFIAIAVGTMFGVEKFKWQQQVPRLLIMAVVINFSRTLAGLMIDASQVVMLTFVNALKDIAGGNFIAMFQLDAILNVNPTTDIQTGAVSPQGMTVFDIFAASFIALIMMGIVLVAMTFLVLILAYRIVVLWVLVAIAPLAWFFKTTQGMIKADPYGDWWKKFLCMLQVGPVLTFFLWLSLAVAGNGTIGADQFPSSGLNEVNIDSVLGAMDQSRLLSFVIGIILLFAGFEAAEQSCGGADGMTKALMGKMKGYSTSLAKLPVAGAGLAGALTIAGGRKGLRGLGALGGGLYNTTVGRGTRAVGDWWTNKKVNWGKVPEGKEGGFFSRTVKSRLANSGQKGLAKRAARTDAAKGKKEWSKEALLTRLASAPPTRAIPKFFDAALAETKDAMMDPKMLEEHPELLKKRLETKYGDKTFLQIMEERFKGDPKFQKNLEGLRVKTPSLLGETGAKAALQENVKDIEGVKKLDEGEFKDKTVRGHVSSLATPFKDKDGKEILMGTAVLQGLLGDKTKSAWIEGAKKTGEFNTPEILAYAPPEEVAIKDVQAESLTPEVLANFAANGSKDFAKELKKTKNLEAKMEEYKNDPTKLDGLLKKGLDRFGKDKEKRQSMLGNLARLGFDPKILFRFDEGVGDFADKEWKDDFKETVGKDKDLILESTNSTNAGFAKAAAGAIDDRSVSGLMRDLSELVEDPSKTPKEKEEKAGQIEKLFASVQRQIEEIDTEEKEEENHGGKLSDEEKNRRKGLRRILKFETQLQRLKKKMTGEEGLEELALDEEPSLDEKDDRVKETVTLQRRLEDLRTKGTLQEKEAAELQAGVQRLSQLESEVDTALKKAQADLKTRETEVKEKKAEYDKAPVEGRRALEGTIETAEKAVSKLRDQIKRLTMPTEPS
ncbi:MAG TPA: hypothetical protein VJB99_03780 [Patescibacteria group bacterium]|nr:hypothetical protein [Patescibacteria group bacterium]